MPAPWFVVARIMPLEEPCRTDTVVRAALLSPAIWIRMVSTSVKSTLSNLAQVSPLDM